MHNQTPANKSSATLDLVVMAVLVVVVWGVSVAVKVFDAFAAFIEKREDWNLDEFVVVGILNKIQQFR